MYYKSSIKHSYVDSDGKHKVATEQFIVQAVDFIDAQTTLTEELAGDRDNFAVKTIAPFSLQDIIFPGNDEIEVEDWYLSRVEFITENSKGKEKRFTNVMLVQATSVTDAQNRIAIHLKDMLIPFEVKKVDKTKILDVFLIPTEETENA